ncbi:WD40/YVTN/BNR-like repeat-containing protein [Cupriavidus ulmosensis]
MALFLLLLIAFISYLHMNDETIWEKISDNFMKDDKPYGPGDFRIRGGDVISMKLSKPQMITRPMTAGQLADPDSRAEFAEAWMYDAAERANRRSLSILAGPLNGPQVRLFDEPAQHGDWWISPDWNQIYLATGWVDHRRKPKLHEYAPQSTRLFKSVDKGQHWQRLAWPEDRDITFLRFIDAQRGYLIGWGPRIWRTGDGGAHWTEIPVPDLARGRANERKQFDLVSLGKDGILRFAFFTSHYAGQQNLSLVYALRWDQDTPVLAFPMPGHTVVDMADHLGHLYILSWKGQPSSTGSDDDMPRPSVISHLGIQAVEPVHEFEPALKGYALYVTPSGGLLLDGVNEAGSAHEDVTSLSYDGGKTWKAENEGANVQGGYYDTTTGTRWQVKGFALYKRAIR